MSANDLEIIKRLAGLTKGETKVENAAPVVEAKIIVENAAVPVVTKETNPEITSGSTFLKFLEEVSASKQNIVEAEECEDEECEDTDEKDDADSEKEEVAEAAETEKEEDESECEEECEDEDEKVDEGLTQEDVTHIRNLITEAAKQKDNQTVAAALAGSILALQQKLGFQNVQEMVIAAGGTITMTKNGNEIAWEEVAEEAGISNMDLEVLGLKKIW